MQRFVKIVFAIIGIGAVAYIALAIKFLFPGDYDPFDKFEVIAIESDPASGNHAASYRYEHANSSNTVFAIWILPDAPKIGSTSPVRGRRQPVVVSLDPADVKSVRWNKSQLQIVSKTKNVRRDGSSCYFEYDAIDLVCINPAFVDIIEK